MSLFAARNTVPSSDLDPLFTMSLETTSRSVYSRRRRTRWSIIAAVVAIVAIAIVAIAVTQVRKGDSTSSQEVLAAQDATQPASQDGSASAAPATNTAELAAEPENVAAAPTESPSAPAPSTTSDNVAGSLDTAVADPVAIESSPAAPAPTEATVAAPSPATAPEVGATVDPKAVSADAPVTATEQSCSDGPGSWTTGPDMPITMGEVASGILTNQGVSYLVVVGEMTKEDAQGPESGKTSILDLASGKWTLGDARPYVGHHHASEVIDNKLYLFGGFRGGSDDKVQIASMTDAGLVWSEGSSIPFGSGSASTAYIGGKVYYCGGIFKHNPDGQTGTMCAKYNVKQDSWDEKVASMAEGRNHAATCTDGERMFVFAGRGPGSGSNNVVANGYANTQIYDPSNDSWVSGPQSGGQPAAIPEGRGGMGKSVHYQGRCYVFGGETLKGKDAAAGISDQGVFDRVDIYDIAKDSWSQGADMPAGRHGVFPVQQGCQLHLAGGGWKAANSQSGEYHIYTI